MSSEFEPKPGPELEPAPDVVPVEVPEELGIVPAGALLAELLDELPIDQIRGFDTVDVATAAYRQLARQQAVFFEALLETGLRVPFTPDTVQRREQPDEFGCEEARAALVWSRQRASTSVGLAFDLFHRLPVLGEAMKRGELDLPRARAFIEWTAGLADQQALHICHQLLPDAPGLMVGELISQIQRACLAIDPQWAKNKYTHAVQQRRVRGFLNPDGTGTLAGYDQPAEKVIAACERIERLTRGCKRAGDIRLLDHVRSDLYIRMLDSSLCQGVVAV